MKDIVLLGPTAVGKTEFAIKLAMKIDAEIISADSVQIHKYLDIGSAKPTKKEQSLVKHHLIDIKKPDESFSAGEFVGAVNKIVEQIHIRGKNVIIVGGSGFYVNSLLFGLDGIEPVDLKIKRFFDDINDIYCSEYLYKWLSVIDKNWAEKIHKNDSQRIKRGLSVYVSTGKLLSECFTAAKSLSDHFSVFILFAEKNFLDKRIERRAEKMIQSGLIDEVKKLIYMGYAQTAPLKSIGYRETLEFLSTSMTKQQLIGLITKNTKSYAKRQMTFFRSRFKDASWINIQNESLEEFIARLEP